MKYKDIRINLFVLATGLFSTYIILHAIFVLAFVCYLPLFILLMNMPKIKAFKTGFIFGVGVSIITFYWMIEGAKEFSGNSAIYGLLIVFFLTIIFSFYWASLIWIVRRFVFKSWILTALSVSASFILAEHVRVLWFSKMPYYLFHSGLPLLNNVYSIQWASLFGLSFLSFIVVFINFSLAHFLFKKDYIRLTIPVLALAVFFIGGLIILQYFKKSEQDIGKEIKVAILAGNSPPKLKWDKYGGDILASRLLNLNAQAVALKPDISLWSECSVPWTYKTDDDFINEVLKVSGPAGVSHLIGINSEYSTNKVYNSVYGLSPQGKIYGRYDKTYLLDFIEAPRLGLSVEFNDLAGFFTQEGQRKGPIPTKMGNAGILICNEIVLSEASLDMVKRGADFLVNLSNDGWFSNCYIVEVHFLYAKLAAVINRRDIVTNSNRGISGYIDASGQVKFQKKGYESFVKLVSVSPSRYDNTAHYRPNLILWFSFIIFAFGIIKHYFQKEITYLRDKDGITSA